MIPSKPVLAFVLTFSVGGRLGEAFRVQNTCLSRQWIGMGALSLRRRTCGYPASRPVPGAMRITTAFAQGRPRGAGCNSRQGGSLVKAQKMEAAEATGSEGTRHAKYGSSMLCCHSLNCTCCTINTAARSGCVATRALCTATSTSYEHSCVGSPHVWCYLVYAVLLKG